MNKPYFNKTEISIGIRWALNCAVASLSEKQKESKNWLKTIRKRYRDFVDLDRELMLEVIPEPETPPQVLQEKSEELGEEKIKEDNKRSENEVEDINTQFQLSKEKEL